MKIEKVKVVGIEDAIRGMRNPLNSWDKSDSKFIKTVNLMWNNGSTLMLNNITDNNIKSIEISYHNRDDNKFYNVLANSYNPYNKENDKNYTIFDSKCNCYYTQDLWNNDSELLKYSKIDTDSIAILGKKDIELAEKLIASGPVHSKFERMIMVYFDLTASFDFWKEFDTYRMGVEKDSCSTMHTIATTPITINNFSTAELTDEDIKFINDSVIPYLNKVKSEDVSKLEITRRLSKLNILGFEQKRTLMCSYAALHNMYIWRKNHKLYEWRHLTNDFISYLPYFNDFYIDNKHYLDNNENKGETL